MTQLNAIMPGGGISRRSLHIFILADCSGSMKIDGRIQALNYAIASITPQLINWEKEQEQAQIFIRAVAFADNASWHIQSPEPISTFNWPPLSHVEKGLTSMGEAIRLVADALSPEKFEPRALRPVLLLITDGKPTDVDQFEIGIKELFANPVGKASIRLAIAIGQGANFSFLNRFINDADIPVMVAENADQIVVKLTAATLAISKMSSIGSDRKEVAEQVIMPEANELGVLDDDTII
ncbi:MAG: tellurium resistance protein [Acidimicrobiales bacterium]|nr:tellurium resistance protein [Acidimicrobiales bacterium]